VECPPFVVVVVLVVAAMASCVLMMENRVTKPQQGARVVSVERAERSDR
jgi:hypothetical protein